MKLNIEAARSSKLSVPVMTRRYSVTSHKAVSFLILLLLLLLVVVVVVVVVVAVVMVVVVVVVVVEVVAVGVVVVGVVVVIVVVVKFWRKNLTVNASYVHNMKKLLTT